MAIQISVVDREGASSQVMWDPGQSLMESLRDNGDLPITASCGGNASCATCHVQMSEEVYQRLGSRNDDEDAILEDAEAFLEEGSRLACQIAYDESCEGIEIKLAPEE